MFVLQDCSICFEDYGAQRVPHSISCGHVFCRPCLDSLVSSSSSCPNCRASIGRKAIRKVVCTLQNSPILDTSILSEAEMIMWQAIESAVDSIDEYEQRRSLVRDNSKLAVQKAGFSRNTLIALDVMRLLVEIENKNRGSDQNMDSARAIEESLRDRISFLEAQLSGTRASFSANIRDFQTLLSQMQQLESSIWNPNDITPQTIRQPTTANPLPPLTNPHTSPPVSIRAASNQEQAPSPPQPKSTPPNTTSWAESQSPWVFDPATTPAESLYPPSPTAARSSYQADAPRMRNPPESSPTSLLSGSDRDWPSLAPSFMASRVSPSATSQPDPPKSWANLAAENSSKSGRADGQRPAPSSSRPQPTSSRPQHTSSTRAPSQRIIIAKIGYEAWSPDELSVTAGEVVELVHGPDSLTDDVDYVMCLGRGGEGYVPRFCLTQIHGL